jgi:hypothetical protein
MSCGWLTFWINAGCYEILPEIFMFFFALGYYYTYYTATKKTGNISRPKRRLFKFHLFALEKQYRFCSGPALHFLLASLGDRGSLSTKDVALKRSIIEPRSRFDSSRSIPFLEQ